MKSRSRVARGDELDARRRGADARAAAGSRAVLVAALANDRPFRGGRTVAAVASRSAERVLHRRRTTAASGRRPTTAARGSRSSTTSRPVPSALSPSLRPIPTSSMSEAAKDCSVRISRPAMASTSRPTRGKTWTHLGLRDGQQIGDHRGSARIPIGCLSRCWAIPYGPNQERGVFRSTDGGETFRRSSTGTRTPARSRSRSIPSNPQIVYAELWAARQGPWENGAVQGREAVSSSRPMVATTWRQLPTAFRRSRRGSGRIGFAIAPSNPKRMYALVDAAATAGSTVRTMRARPGARQRRSRDSGGAGDFAEVRSIRRIPISSSSQRRYIPLDRWRKDVHAIRAHPAATTIIASGSIPTIPRSCCSRAIRARRSR